MKLNFIRDSNQFYVENYYIFLNNQKYKLPVHLNFEKQEGQFEFYVKTAWMKSKLYTITGDRNYVIRIGNIITQRIYFTVVITLLILLILASYLDTDFMWDLTTFLFLVGGCFQLYLYTFGQNFSIKVKIEES